MKVKDLMNRMTATCTPETDLGTAVEMLWNHNCGMLPIVNAQKIVVGVLTDRDICLALGTRNQVAGNITAKEVKQGEVFTCMPEDDLSEALATMARARVRRLPVVDISGALEGVLSMDDVLVHSEPESTTRADGISHAEVVDTLKQVYRPGMPLAMRRTNAA